jgi:hypothetical protein
MDHEWRALSLLYNNPPYARTHARPRPRPTRPPPRQLCIIKAREIYSRISDTEADPNDADAVEAKLSLYGNLFTAWDDALQ